MEETVTNAATWSNPWLWFGLGVVLVLLPWAVYVFNRLWVKHQAFKEAKGDIAAFLHKRKGLLPQFRAVFWSYLEHEKMTWGFVAYVKAHWPHLAKGAKNPGAVLKQLGPLELLALREAFPGIKAYLPAREILREVALVEEQLAQAKVRANAAAQEYNSWRGMFPNILVASLTNLRPAEYTEPPEDQQPPSLELPSTSYLPPLSEIDDNGKKEGAAVGKESQATEPREEEESAPETR